ncbi:MAG: ProQ/FinO family protein [Sulfuritalea sp.]|jgi:ProP effector|nr:ProQ/FinO family protein [Sulfuritalea sp.]MBP8897337.1 ProQ/FinO family protein [Sulfuritalea sp.]
MLSSPPHRDPVLARLVATYPVFRDIQPLAVGIHKAIIAAHPDIDKAALRRTLQRHTASTRYLKVVAAGGSRFGLDGVPTGDITPEQQKQANQDLKDRFRKQAEQRREQLKAQEHQAKLQQLVDKFGQK